MYVLGRQNFDPLPLIADIVRFTQYIFRERRVHISGTDVLFLNTCLALAIGM